jgi:DNA-directed RNA polymerase subunit RPC12/RpoP
MKVTCIHCQKEIPQDDIKEIDSFMAYICPHCHCSVFDKKVES